MDGLVARWRSGQFWPYDKTSLSVHPLATAEPELLRQIEVTVLQRMARPEFEPIALLHSDLHSDHIFAADDSLTAVIDFGGAFIGPLSWEFAPIGLFLGWDVMEVLMQYYAQLSGYAQSAMFSTVKTTALIFGLYRYAVESQGNRLHIEGPKIVDFLKESARRAAILS